MINGDLADTNGIMINGPESITAVFVPTATPPSPPEPPVDPGASEDGLHVPTGFSPNGDNNNDVFSIMVGKDVASFTFFVYDRWGNRMVHSTDPNLEWDGTFNGEPVNAGVYPYMYEVTYTSGLHEWHSGNITVIK